MLSCIFIMYFLSFFHFPNQKFISRSILSVWLWPIGAGWGSPQSSKAGKWAPLLYEPPTLQCWWVAGGKHPILGEDFPFTFSWGYSAGWPCTPPPPHLVSSISLLGFSFLFISSCLHYGTKNFTWNVTVQNIRNILLIWSCFAYFKTRRFDFLHKDKKISQIFNVSGTVLPLNYFQSFLLSSLMSWGNNFIYIVCYQLARCSCNI